MDRNANAAAGPSRISDVPLRRLSRRRGASQGVESESDGGDAVRGTSSTKRRRTTRSRPAATATAHMAARIETVTEEASIIATPPNGGHRNKEAVTAASGSGSRQSRIDSLGARRQSDNATSSRTTNVDIRSGSTPPQPRALERVGSSGSPHSPRSARSSSARQRHPSSGLLASPFNSPRRPRVRPSLVREMPLGMSLEFRSEMIAACADDVLEKLFAANLDMQDDDQEEEELQSWTGLQSNLYNYLFASHVLFPDAEDVLGHLRPGLRNHEHVEYLRASLQRVDLATLLWIIVRPENAYELLPAHDRDAAQGKGRVRESLLDAGNVERRNRVLIQAWKVWWRILPISEAAIQLWLDFATHIVLFWQCASIDPPQRPNPSFNLVPEGLAEQLFSPHALGRHATHLSEEDHAHWGKVWTALATEREQDLSSNRHTTLRRQHNFADFRDSFRSFVDRKIQPTNEDDRMSAVSARTEDTPQVSDTQSEASSREAVRAIEAQVVKETVETLETIEVVAVRETDAGTPRIVIGNQLVFPIPEEAQLVSATTNEQVPSTDEVQRGSDLVDLDALASLRASPDEPPARPTDEVQPGSNMVDFEALASLRDMDDDYWLAAPPVTAGVSPKTPYTPTPGDEWAIRDAPGGALHARRQGSGLRVGFSFATRQPDAEQVGWDSDASTPRQRKPQLPSDGSPRSRRAHADVGGEMDMDDDVLPYESQLAPRDDTQGINEAEEGADVLPSESQLAPAMDETQSQRMQSSSPPVDDDGDIIPSDSQLMPLEESAEESDDEGGDDQSHPGDVQQEDSKAVQIPDDDNPGADADVTIQPQQRVYDYDYDSDNSFLAAAAEVEREDALFAAAEDDEDVLPTASQLGAHLSDASYSSEEEQGNEQEDSLDAAWRAHAAATDDEDGEDLDDILPGVLQFQGDTNDSQDESDHDERLSEAGDERHDDEMGAEHQTDEVGRDDVAVHSAVGSGATEHDTNTRSAPLFLDFSPHSSPPVHRSSRRSSSAAPRPCSSQPGTLEHQHMPNTNGTGMDVDAAIAPPSAQPQRPDVASEDAAETEPVDLPAQPSSGQQTTPPPAAQLVPPLPTPTQNDVRGRVWDAAELTEFAPADGLDIAEDQWLGLTRPRERGQKRLRGPRKERRQNAQQAEVPARADMEVPVERPAGPEEEETEEEEERVLEEDEINGDAGHVAEDEAENEPEDEAEGIDWGDLDLSLTAVKSEFVARSGHTESDDDPEVELLSREELLERMLMTDNGGRPFLPHPDHRIPLGHRPPGRNANGQRGRWSDGEMVLLWRTVQRTPYEEEYPAAVVAYLYGPQGVKTQDLARFTVQNLKDKLRQMIEKRLGHGLPVEGRARRFLPQIHELRQAHDNERMEYLAEMEEREREREGEEDEEMEDEDEGEEMGAGGGNEMEDQDEDEDVFVDADDGRGWYGEADDEANDQGIYDDGQDDEQHQPHHDGDDQANGHPAVHPEPLSSPTHATWRVDPTSHVDVAELDELDSSDSSDHDSDAPHPVPLFLPRRSTSDPDSDLSSNSIADFRIIKSRLRQFPPPFEVRVSARKRLRRRSGLTPDSDSESESESARQPLASKRKVAHAATNAPSKSRPRNTSVADGQRLRFAGVEIPARVKRRVKRARASQDGDNVRRARGVDEEHDEGESRHGDGDENAQEDAHQNADEIGRENGRGEDEAEDESEEEDADEDGPDEGGHVREGASAEGNAVQEEAQDDDTHMAGDTGPTDAAADADKEAETAVRRALIRRMVLHTGTHVV